MNWKVPAMKKRNRHKIYFTLVELLVVISIIMLLMSVLMPALKQVRNKAKSIKCTSNMRQIGLAETQYMTDSNSWTTPIFDNFPDTGGTYNWAELLSEGGYIPRPVIGKSTLLLCPSWPPYVYEHRQYIYGFFDYGYYGPFRIGGADVTALSSSGSTVTINCAPSKFFYIADSISVSTLKQRYQYTNGVSVTIHVRHDLKANLLFGDGHVSPKSSMELKNNTDIYSTGFNSYY